MPSFAEIREALLHAASLIGADRDAYLAELERRDPELSREVESLLAEDEAPMHIVETGALAEGLGSSLAEALDSASHAPLPDRIGPYRVAEVLGEGGMGIVYRAQHERTARAVAVKVIRRGLDTDKVIARFEAERRALAMMSHRSIAAVHDAGADDAGRPWFAMELAEGEPIDAYCDSRRLTLRERLELFLEVCDAVQHAHRKGIVHRDLKPSNLLVRDGPERPRLAVIDFGIAKAMAETTESAEELTAHGQYLGTPAYMSPEQAGAFGGKVDERSDVFALGVVLHLLLTGTMPHHYEGRSAVGLLAWLRESEPSLPSGLIEQARERGLDVDSWSRARGVTPDMLESQMRGDLDHVLVKAMRREPATRYGQVQELAADIGRFLVGTAVHAAGDTIELRAGTSTSHNLPHVPTRLVGREKEVGEVLTLLENQRVVTLTGAAGSGKTRLAIRAAERLLPRSPDGVHFVDLAVVREPERVAPALGALLEAHADSDSTPIEAVVRALRDASSLVLLDNCEHMIPAVAELIDALIRNCPGVRVLATSREMLGVEGELVFAVPTLDVPASGDADVGRIQQSHAVRLFTDRASLVVPGFTMNDGTARDIADICRRLDGIPLAIELAASRVNVLSIRELRERLGDRFRLLTGGRRSGPPRHKTLRAAIEWSHQALAAEEAVLFRRLAVFEGGWTLEAAETVDALGTAELEHLTLDALSRLVEKSLVVVDQQPGRSTRYRFLETIREFALEQLRAAGEEEGVREAQVAAVLEFAERAGPRLHGAGLERWLGEVEAEHANVLIVVERTTRPGYPVGTALRIGRLLWTFWWISGRLDAGYRTLDTIRLHDAQASPTKDRAVVMRALGAIALYFLPDKSVARGHMEEAVRICEAIGDRVELGHALQGLTNLLIGAGELDEARARAQRALELSRAENSPRGAAGALNSMGEIERARGNFRAAIPFYRESAEIVAGLEQYESEGQVLLNVAMCFVALGDLADSRDSLSRALDRIMQVGGRHFATDALDIAAAIADLEHEPERSARLYGAAHRLRTEMGSDRDPVDAAPHVETEKRLRDRLGEAPYEELMREGAAATFDETMAELHAWLGGSQRS